MYKFFLSTIVCGLLFLAPAYAQEAAPTAAATPAPVAVPAQPDPYAPFEGSFFLSPLEIVSIRQAMNGRMTDERMLRDDNGAQLPAHRVIRMSGVLYRAPGDWIVWMNGKKVTPNNLLPEIIDISVMNSSKVNLKWYDAGLRKVISITLRPQQVYDITTGILLPGSE
jgi:hypothetical protein